MEKIDRAEAISKLKETVYDPKELKDIIRTLEELPEIKEYNKQIMGILDDFDTCSFITVGCENCRAGVKIGKSTLSICDVLTAYGQQIYTRISNVLKG